MIWLFLPVLLAGLTLLIQFALSFINSRQVKGVYSYLIKDARNKSRRSFTLVTSLTRRAETIIPLLDHLEGFRYKKLQVIVIVKQTAGPNAKRMLEAYRRRSGLHLTIVKHRRGLSYETVVGRYATGDYVMQIDSTDRLSPRFFDLASQILYSTRVGALAIRNHLRPRRTFLQAAWSLIYLFSGIGMVMGLNGNKKRQHVISKRKLIISGKTVEARPYLAEQLHIDVTLGVIKLNLSSAYLSIAAAVGALMVASYYLIGRFTGPYESSIFGIVALITIMVCTITMMASLRGFKLIDYINMVLFVPLLPIFAINKLLQYLSARSWQTKKRNYVSRTLRESNNIH